MFHEVAGGEQARSRRPMTRRASRRSVSSAAAPAENQQKVAASRSRPAHHADLPRPLYPWIARQNRTGRMKTRTIQWRRRAGNWRGRRSRNCGGPAAGKFSSGFFCRVSSNPQEQRQRPPAATIVKPDNESRSETNHPCCLPPARSAARSKPIAHGDDTRPIAPRAAAASFIGLASSENHKHGRSSAPPARELT